MDGFSTFTQRILTEAKYPTRVGKSASIKQYFDFVSPYLVILSGVGVFNLFHIFLKLTLSQIVKQAIKLLQ